LQEQRGNTDKINELETNGKNKNIRNLYRRTNEFKKHYQPRTSTKDENDLLADSYNILNRWKNDLSAIDLYGMNDVRHTDMHTTVSLVS
jgi:hypothetical protein